MGRGSADRAAGMTFTVTIADADLAAIDEEMGRIALAGTTMPICPKVRVLAMVLGAAKAAGFGSRRRRKA